MRGTSQNVYAMQEPLSPELALVDPELAARARAALPDPVRRPARRAAVAAAPAPVGDRAPERAESSHPYPLWARVTAALWLLVLGILIGGAAVPHAQDRPRVLSPAEDAAAEICEPATTTPAVPGLGSPLRPGP
jgi:hypothetical protein